jgi:hypothetical protein
VTLQQLSLFSFDVNHGSRWMSLAMPASCETPASVPQAEGWSRKRDSRIAIEHFDRRQICRDGGTVLVLPRAADWDVGLVHAALILMQQRCPRWRESGQGLVGSRARRDDSRRSVRWLGTLVFAAREKLLFLGNGRAADRGCA